VKGCALVLVLACGALLLGYYLMRQTWLSPKGARPSSSYDECPWVRGTRHAPEAAQQLTALLKEQGVTASISIELSGEFHCEEFLSNRTTFRVSLMGPRLADPAERERIRAVVLDFAHEFDPSDGTALALRFPLNGVPDESWVHSYDAQKRQSSWGQVPG
jgi:hypothetical protein